MVAVVVGTAVEFEELQWQRWRIYRNSGVIGSALAAIRLGQG